MAGPERQRGSVIERLPVGARVLVVRLRSMGDCVLTTPAIHLLKAHRPDLEIAVVVEERFAGIFEGNPDIAELLPPDYRAAARFRPHLCLNLHGGTRSQLLTLASVAGVRAGFGHHRGAWLYTVKIPRAQQVYANERTFHTAEQLASAVFHLGVPFAEVPRARIFAGPAQAERPYAVIHPTAAMPYKTWRPEGFAEVARHIDTALGLEPVFIGAVGDDLAPFAGFRRVRGAPLEQLKPLLGGASLFVGNDSGPAHIACALGVPVVVLFGRPEHQIVWAPWRPAAARTLVSAEGIAAIPAADVIAAVGQVMR